MLIFSLIFKSVMEDTNDVMMFHPLKTETTNDRQDG